MNRLDPAFAIDCLLDQADERYYIFYESIAEFLTYAQNAGYCLSDVNFSTKSESVYINMTVRDKDIRVRFSCHGPRGNEKLYDYDYNFGISESRNLSNIICLCLDKTATASKYTK